MTTIQEMVWQRMLQVEFNAVYWDKKAFWLSFRLRSLQLVLALIGCTAFASLFSGPGFGLFNKVLTVLAVGLGLYLSHFDLRVSLFQIEAIREKYGRFYARFEQLWNEVNLGLAAQG